MPEPIRLRIRSIPLDRMPAGASPESWLTVEVGRRFDGSGAVGAAAVVVRERSLDLVDLVEPSKAGLQLVPFLGGLSTTVTAGGRAQAVGIVGQLQLHRRDRPGPSVPVAAAFLEWEDCRWWMWQCLLDGHRLREATITERAAVDGDAMPDGIGRYWTWARRNGVRGHLELKPVVPAAVDLPRPTDGVVH